MIILPNMSSVIDQFTQEITLIKLTEVIDKGFVTYTEQEINFIGVVEPVKPENLKVRPEGERGWKYQEIYTTTEQNLKIAEKIKYAGTRYKIIEVNNYEAYGYFKYLIIEDYDG